MGKKNAWIKKKNYSKDLEETKFYIDAGEWKYKDRWEKVHKNHSLLEFPLWYSGNESDWYPWGSGSILAWVGDPVLLWLWRRPAAVSPIWPLAWEPLYATGMALKEKKKSLFTLSSVTAMMSFLKKENLYFQVAWERQKFQLSTRITGILVIA